MAADKRTFQPIMTEKDGGREGGREGKCFCFRTQMGFSHRHGADFDCLVDGRQDVARRPVASLVLISASDVQLLFLFRRIKKMEKIPLP